jgi:hypothetical protein
MTTFRNEPIASPKSPAKSARAVGGIAAKSSMIRSLAPAGYRKSRRSKTNVAATSTMAEYPTP